MVIDVHCHLLVREFENEAYWEYLARFIAEDLGTIAGKTISPREVEETLLPEWWDPHGERTVRRMDEAGIEKAVLLPLDTGLIWGEGKIDIVEQHRQIGEIARRYPERFIYFCQVDPRRPEALELLERSVKEWGARGLKLYPTTGFNPDDEVCYPFLERLSEWGMPLIVHTGPEPPPMISEGCHPRRLERILADFPDLTVIACHLAVVWWRELIALGQTRKNLMADFSAHQPTAKGSIGRFCHILRRFLDGMGKDRVMFGTDTPTLEHLIPSREWVQFIRDLPGNSPEGMAFTEEEVSAVLYGNAQRVFAPKA